MISELQNKKLLNIDILNDFLLASGEKVDYEMFKELLNEQDNESYKSIALKFNNEIRTITRDEYNKVASPITARITKVHPDGYIDVQKPTDKEGNCWTRIPNPTIFRYLDVGDEVVLGYYKGEQKSNCWVMFAKLTPVEFKKKTIYKDIENLKIINNNTQLLQKWLKDLGMDGEIQNVYS